MLLLVVVGLSATGRTAAKVRGGVGSTNALQSRPVDLALDVRGDPVLAATEQSSFPVLRQTNAGTPVQGVDYGTRWAATSPLVGLTVPWVFGEHTRNKLPKSACAPLHASVDRHAYWFDKAPNSQQAEERNFLASIPTVLCAEPEQSDDAYTQRLHGMIQVARAAINRHTHSAFWVKATCAELDTICWKPGVIQATYFSNVTNDEVCDLVDDHYALSCLQEVLVHEKHNLAEGTYFANMTNYMIERGGAFCRDPNLESVLTTMSAEMEARMAYHSSSMAFDDMLNSLFNQLCTLPDDNETTYDTAYQAMIARVDDRVLNVLDEDCTFSEDSFRLMSYIHNNPPDANDMISIIEGNTRVAISAATETVYNLLSTQQCLNSVTGAADTMATARLLAKLNKSSLPQSALPGNTKSASQRQSFLTVPTVYHKIAPTCVPVESKSNRTHTAVCYADDNGGVQMNCAESSAGNPTPIFDLSTSTDLSACSGEPCKAAAKAVGAYQEMLDPITKMRWNLIQIAQGSSEGVPLLDQDTWTFQRSCDAYNSIIEAGAHLLHELPTVIANLRQAAPQLSTSCVAPARDWPDMDPIYSPVRTSVNPFNDWDHLGCHM